MNLHHVKQDFKFWWANLTAGPRHWYDWPMHVVVTTIRELAYTIGHVALYGAAAYAVVARIA